MFGRKRKPRCGEWIRREHLFGGDDYVCSVCGAKFKKQSSVCPKCNTLMTKVKADLQWIDEMELLEMLAE